MELLAVKNLSFSYPGSAGRVLDGVNLTVGAGDFLVLCGQSGCGKTTLLRLIKRELAPYGAESGDLLFRGEDLRKADARRCAAEIGFVQQNPEMQIVTDRVWHELAFGPESLGMPTDAIRRRVGETAGWFGIESWFRRETANLSGGQKQLLNLAAVMTLSPALLLLDEPTSQLDPVAASSFLHTLYRVNRELGVTVIIAEHRLEGVFPMADRVCVMENGRIVACDEPRKVCRALAEHPIAAGFPSAVRIAAGIGKTDRIPLTVREGRALLSELPRTSVPLPEERPVDDPPLLMEKVWFRYDRNGQDILRGVRLAVRRGEFFSVLGGNGAGKTTLLRVLSGTEKAYRGKTQILGKNIREYRQADLHRHTVALLPQNVRTVFLGKTVREDLSDICRVMAYPESETDRRVETVAERLGITAILDRHPYDLSGGEAQKAALAKLLLTEPRILLLDEPTKGIDPYAKRSLAAILRGLCDNGITVLMVSHDVEFAAAVSDRCALFFDGEVLAPAVPERFFGTNSFYTTAASRIARGIIDGAVTVEEVVRAARKGVPDEADR